MIAYLFVFTIGAFIGTIYARHQCRMQLDTYRCYLAAMSARVALTAARFHEWQTRNHHFVEHLRQFAPLWTVEPAAQLIGIVEESIDYLPFPDQQP